LPTLHAMQQKRSSHPKERGRSNGILLKKKVRKYAGIFIALRNIQSKNVTQTLLVPTDRIPLRRSRPRSSSSAHRAPQCTRVSQTRTGRSEFLLAAPDLSGRAEISGRISRSRHAGASMCSPGDTQASSVAHQLLPTPSVLGPTPGTHMQSDGASCD